jgi:hypothetical protein
MSAHSWKQKFGKRQKILSKKQSARVWHQYLRATPGGFLEKALARQQSAFVVVHPSVRVRLARGSHVDFDRVVRLMRKELPVTVHRNLSILEINGDDSLWAFDDHPCGQVFRPRKERHTAHISLEGLQV